MNEQYLQIWVKAHKFVTATGEALKIQLETDKQAHRLRFNLYKALKSYRKVPNYDPMLSEIAAVGYSISKHKTDNGCYLLIGKDSLPDILDKICNNIPNAETGQNVLEIAMGEGIA